MGMERESQWFSIGINSFHVWKTTLEKLTLKPLKSTQAWGLWLVCSAGRGAYLQDPRGCFKTTLFHFFGIISLDISGKVCCG